MGEALKPAQPLTHGLLACLITLLVLMFPQPAFSNTGSTGAPETTADKQLGELLQAISARAGLARTLKMEFTQHKNLSSFERSIVIRGSTLVDKRRGYLAWHVNEPVRYSVIIKGRRIWQWDEQSDKVQEMPVSKLPALDIALSQIRLLFEGDLVQVAQRYDARQTGESPTVIQFTPKEDSPGHMGLKMLTVTIRENSLDLASIRIEDKNGDSTVIEFDKVQRNLEFNEEDFSLKDFWRTNKL